MSPNLAGQSMTPTTPFLHLRNYLPVVALLIAAQANAQGKLLRITVAIDDEFRGYCIDAMAAVPMRESMRRSESIPEKRTDTAA